jgi:itaconate CoA-transferase
VGTLPALIPPATSSAFSHRMDAIPALGQNTADILAELGYGGDTIKAFADKGII